MFCACKSFTNLGTNEIWIMLKLGCGGVRKRKENYSHEPSKLSDVKQITVSLASHKIQHKKCFVFACEW